MGLLSSIFGSPSKEQIDRQIADLEEQIGYWKAWIANTQSLSVSPGQKRANQNAIAYCGSKGKNSTFKSPKKECKVICKTNQGCGAVKLRSLQFSTSNVNYIWNQITTEMRP